MKRKELYIFIVIVFALVAMNKLVMNSNNNNLYSTDEELVNRDYISSQRLFDNVWTEIKDNYYDPTLNHQQWRHWKEHYHGKIKTDEDVKVAVDTMLASLDDPYSRYMTKSEYADQNTSINSKITGIGVNISAISGKIQIINVIDGTPAQSANLQNGDIILDIDGKDANGMSIAEVANLVRGPENTFVKLTVLRDKDKLVKNVMRKEIKIKSVRSSIDKNIGYIQITSFIGSTTPNEFLEALEKTKKTDGLIIDLRGNTGGLLPNAVFIANLFIPEGNIVSIVGRNGYRYDIQAQNTDFGIEKPVIVLVDGASASASEILSGALKDYHKAKIVGTRTYGKGMVQKIIPMPNETGLNLTVAKYLTPSGTDINKKGIKPDVEVQFTAKDIKNQNDVQLSEAKKLMSRMLSENKCCSTK
ncbi:TPA: S41 family peptidase [Candidatus Scatousia excrementigallinarum]|uniref:S41 family peptidase n=1 Tax=Candidatus Scatousia excrementigallinarum TaxID=2840935 RepID=A0A9D1JMK8_9BACT|nr:S41 family peptidase [Candidatus Scatousia excrementigallinarum]